jgi:WD40 repeat protein
VHLYDTFAHYPLHIQGFDSKVKALAWQHDGTWLAVSGGAGVTLWPCMGKNGPEGANPVELTGHTRDVLALDFLPGGAYLASGAKDGKVLLWRPHSDTDSVVVAQRAHPVTALRWSPDGRALAFGTAAGELTIFRLKQNLPPSR